MDGGGRGTARWGLVRFVCPRPRRLFASESIEICIFYRSISAACECATLAAAAGPRRRRQLAYSRVSGRWERDEKLEKIATQSLILLYWPINFATAALAHRVHRRRRCRRRNRPALLRALVLLHPRALILKNACADCELYFYAFWSPPFADAARGVV